MTQSPKSYYYDERRHCYRPIQEMNVPVVRRPRRKHWVNVVLSLVVGLLLIGVSLLILGRLDGAMHADEPNKTIPKNADSLKLQLQR